MNTRIPVSEAFARLCREKGYTSAMLSGLDYTRILSHLYRQEFRSEITRRPTPPPPPPKHCCCKGACR